MSDPLTFEQAVERINGLVKGLESGSLSLEDSLKAFEEGVGLVKVCQSKLAQAEKKIQILTKGNGPGDADPQFEPFKGVE